MALLFWGEPLRCYLDTASAFLKAFLHLLAGEGVWGRGRHLSPFPQESLEFFLLFFLFS